MVQDIIDASGLAWLFALANKFGFESLNTAGTYISLGLLLCAFVSIFVIFIKNRNKRR